MSHQTDPVEAKALALRALDGMTVNRDKMARAMVSLADEVIAWRAAFVKQKAEGPKSSTGGFFKEHGDAYDAIFGVRK